VKLTGQQIQQVHSAFLDAFTPESLRMMVRVHLDESLFNIAGGATFSDQVFALIEWAETTGSIPRLLTGAVKSISGNELLQVLWSNSQSWTQSSIQLPPHNESATQIDFDWVTIRASSFSFGKKEDEIYGSTMKQVYVPRFRIAKVPVTNSQYEKFVDCTGYSTPPDWRHGQIPPARSEHPVINVTFKDAVEFCRWAGVRLPTEVEWEKAARGTDERIYPWGNFEPAEDLCNFDMNVKRTTHVGSYPKGASPYGVLDMAGNVWELTFSAYYECERELEQTEENILRAAKGGSFASPIAVIQCSSRQFFDSDEYDFRLGFRVVAVD
jgi:formylglycine-generating enzyme required for sulfatase activity